MIVNVNLLFYDGIVNQKHQCTRGHTVEDGRKCHSSGRVPSCTLRVKSERIEDESSDLYGKRKGGSQTASDAGVRRQ